MSKRRKTLTERISMDQLHSEGIYAWAPCPACGGAGKYSEIRFNIVTKACNRCGGRGRIRVKGPGHP